MKKQMFDELVASIEQAGEIHRGEAKASRTFMFEPEDIGQMADSRRLVDARLSVSGRARSERRRSQNRE